jgi:hypothetical protein
MNNRILELMRQADYPAPEIALRAQRLAELIVRECCTAMESTDRHRSDYFIAKVKEHFGVEE